MAALCSKGDFSHLLAANPEQPIGESRESRSTGMCRGDMIQCRMHRWVERKFALNSLFRWTCRGGCRVVESVHMHALLQPHPVARAGVRRQVLIVDDHNFFAGCLRTLLDHESDLVVCDI